MLAAGASSDDLTSRKLQALVTRINNKYNIDVLNNYRDEENNLSFKFTRNENRTVIFKFEDPVFSCKIDNQGNVAHLISAEEKKEEMIKYIASLPIGIEEVAVRGRGSRVVEAVNYARQESLKQIFNQIKSSSKLGTIYEDKELAERGIKLKFKMDTPHILFLNYNNNIFKIWENGAFEVLGDSKIEVLPTIIDALNDRLHDIVLSNITPTSPALYPAVPASSPFRVARPSHAGRGHVVVGESLMASAGLVATPPLGPREDSDLRAIVDMVNGSVLTLDVASYIEEGGQVVQYRKNSNRTVSFMFNEYQFDVNNIGRVVCYSAGDAEAIEAALDSIKTVLLTKKAIGVVLEDNFVTPDVVENPDAGDEDLVAASVDPSNIEERQRERLKAICNKIIEAVDVAKPDLVCDVKNGLRYSCDYNGVEGVIKIGINESSNEFCINFNQEGSEASEGESNNGTITLEDLLNRFEAAEAFGGMFVPEVPSAVFAAPVAAAVVAPIVAPQVSGAPAVGVTLGL